MMTQTYRQTTSWAAVCLAMLLTVTDGRGQDEAESRLDWPSWRGPHHSGTAVAPPGTQMLDPKDMKLLWASDTEIPWGWNHPNGLPGGGIGGGYSAPIVVGDSVYVYFFRPSGPVSQECKKKARVKDDAKWGAVADDVLVCFDARTGKTRWEASFAQTGMNLNKGNSGTMCTPAVLGDVIMVQGNGGWAFGVHRVTGEKLWRTELGNSDARGALIREPEQLLADHMTFAVEWTGLGSAIGVDGVALLEDSHGTYYGLDSKTGSILWGPLYCNPGWTGRAPVIWRHGGKAYFILFNMAIEPRTGKVLWKEKKAKGLHVIEGDVAVDQLGVAWTLSPSGAEPAYPWSKKQQQKYYWDLKTPTILDGVAYGEPGRGTQRHAKYNRKRRGLLAIDLATGQVSTNSCSLGEFDYITQADKGWKHDMQAGCQSPLGYGDHLFGGWHAHVVVSRIDKEKKTLSCVGAIPALAAIPAPTAITANSSMAASRGRLYVRVQGFEGSLLGRLHCYQIARDIAYAPVQSSGKADPAVAGLGAELEALGSPHLLERRAAAANLVGKPDHAVALAKLVRDGRLQTRTAACDALRQMGGAGAQAAPLLSETCLAMTKTGTPETAAMVAGAVRAVDPAEARKLALALSGLAGESRAACRALGELGEAGAAGVPGLIAALASEDLLLRREAADALAAIKPKSSEAAEALGKAAASTSPQALRALCAMGVNAQPALDAVGQALVHPTDRASRYWAARVVQNLGGGAAKVLSAIVQGKQLPQNLRSRSHDGLISTAYDRALEAVSDSAYGQLVQMVLDDGEDAKYAYAVLEQFKPLPATCVPALMRHVPEDRRLGRPAAQALARIGPEAKAAIPVLLEQCSDIRRKDKSYVTAVVEAIIAIDKSHMPTVAVGIADALIPFLASNPGAVKVGENYPLLLVCAPWLDATYAKRTHEAMAVASPNSMKEIDTDAWRARWGMERKKTEGE